MTRVAPTRSVPTLCVRCTPTSRLLGLDIYLWQAWGDSSSSRSAPYPVKSIGRSVTSLSTMSTRAHEIDAARLDQFQEDSSGSCCPIRMWGVAGIPRAPSRKTLDHIQSHASVGSARDLKLQRLQTSYLRHQCKVPSHSMTPRASPEGVTIPHSSVRREPADCYIWYLPMYPRYLHSTLGKPTFAVQTRFDYPSPNTSRPTAGYEPSYADSVRTRPSGGYEVLETTLAAP